MILDNKNILKVQFLGVKHCTILYIYCSVPVVIWFSTPSLEAEVGVAAREELAEWPVREMIAILG